MWEGGQLLQRWLLLQCWPLLLLCARCIVCQWHASHEGTFCTSPTALAQHMPAASAAASSKVLLPDAAVSSAFLVSEHD